GGSRRTGPLESRRSASSGVRAQPSWRHESTAALSIGMGGRVGSASGGPAWRRVRPSRPRASRAGLTAGHCGRTAAMRASALSFRPGLASASMLGFIHHGRGHMKFAWSCVSAAFAACFVVGTAGAQDTIKIGVTQPLTGAFAASGNYVAQGAKLAEEEINKQGGVLGKKIQLVIEDNKSNPTEAVATAEKLISKD